MKAVLTSLKTAFLSISRSRYKQRQISMVISLTNVWRFCANFWVIFGHFGKEIFLLKGEVVKLRKIKNFEDLMDLEIEI